MLGKIVCQSRFLRQWGSPFPPEMSTPSAVSSVTYHCQSSGTSANCVQVSIAPSCSDYQQALPNLDASVKSYPDGKIVSRPIRLGRGLSHVLLAAVPRIGVKGAVWRRNIGQIRVPKGKVLTRHGEEVGHALALVDPRRALDGACVLVVGPVKVSEAVVSCSWS